MTKKQSLRAELQYQLNRSELLKNDRGKTAERVRSLPAYKNAGSIFTSGAVFLQQLRINCLLDGKDLVMPAPGLKNGFYEIKPHRISFKKLNQAVSLRGLPNFGRHLTPEDVSRLNIEILFTDALAVDGNGVRLGSGNGYFDLSYALLKEFGGLSAHPPVFALLCEEQLVDRPLPFDPWDVKMSGAVTSGRILFFNNEKQPQPKIIWKELSVQRIRKIDPLWILFSKDQPKTSHPKRS